MLRDFVQLALLTVVAVLAVTATPCVIEHLERSVMILYDVAGVAYVVVALTALTFSRCLGRMMKPPFRLATIIASATLLETVGSMAEQVGSEEIALWCMRTSIALATVLCLL